MGSWKIIAIWLPRMSRSRRGFIVSRSLPWNSAWPEMIDVFFADPDSPTMPSVLPLSTEKLTPSTALTMPSSVRKYVLRSFTSSSDMHRLLLLREPDSRVDPRVDQVDHQVEDHDTERPEDDD